MKSDPHPHAPTCQHCQSEMEYEKVTEKDMGLQLLGVVLGIAGIAAMVTLGMIGIILGLCLLVVAARLGYKQRLGWHCHNCGYFFEAKRS